MSLLVLMLSGCGFELPDSARLSLDYQIDRPRLVGLSVTPPVLQPGTTSTFEALFLDPEYAEPQTLRWDVCGLRDDVWVVNYGLDCFGQSELVTRIGDANPSEWEPRTSDASCDATVCGHMVPLLVTAEVDGEAYRASSMIEIFGEEVWTDVDLARPTLHEQGVGLTYTRDESGRVLLTAAVDARFESLDWRWYVDGGVLLKTGRTQTQGEVGAAMLGEDPSRMHTLRTWTDNTWELPDEPGVYRVVIVVDGDRASEWGETKDEKEDEKEDETRSEWLYTDNPDQAWAIVEVEQP